MRRPGTCQYAAIEPDWAFAPVSLLFFLLISLVFFRLDRGGQNQFQIAGLQRILVVA